MEERKRLNAAEQVSLYGLFGAIHMLQDNRLEGRLGRVQDGKQNLELARDIVARLAADVMSTAPAEQLTSIRRNMSDIEAQVKVKKPVQRVDDEYGRWITWGAMKQFGEIAKEHCMMCNKDYDAQCKCELRKAFDELPTDPPEHYHGCPYYTMWAQIC